MKIKEVELAGSEDEQELGLSAVSLTETEEPAEPEEELVDNQSIIHSPTGRPELSSVPVEAEVL